MSRDGRFESPVTAKALTFTALVLAGCVQAGMAQIVAPAGRTLFNRGVMLRCLARADFFEAAPALGDGHRVSLPCAFTWGVYPDTSFVAVLPWAVNREEADGTEAGVGDATLLVQYDGLFRRTVPRGFTRLGLQAGAILPTGASGFTQDAPGFFLTGIFSHIRDRHWLIADVQRAWNGEDDGLDLGDRWRFDAAYLYRLLPRGAFRGDNLFLVFELNAEAAGRSEVAGRELADSGGEVLFLSPGVEYLPTRRLVLEFAVPIPVHRDFNGLQREPGVSLIGGVRVLF